MPYQKACGLIAQALEGLSWFHEKGYVHRDIKPENILLLADGMGGHNAGEVASKLAVDAAHDFLKDGISTVADSLIEVSNNKGGRDNISVVIVQYG